MPKTTGLNIPQNPSMTKNKPSITANMFTADNGFFIELYLRCTTNITNLSPV